MAHWNFTHLPNVLTGVSVVSGETQYNVGAAFGWRMSANACCTHRAQITLQATVLPQYCKLSLLILWAPACPIGNGVKSCWSRPDFARLQCGVSGCIRLAFG